MKAVSMLAKGKPITLGDFFQSHLSALNQPTRPFNPNRPQLPLTRWNPIAAASSSKTTLSITNSSKGNRVAIEDSDFPPLQSQPDPNSRAGLFNVSPAQPLPTTGQTPPSKSFREAVSATWAQNVDVSLPPVSDGALSTYMGEPAVIISEEEERTLAQTFQFALIGKFSRGRPQMASIRKSISAAGFKGEVYVGLIDHRHIILQFQEQTDFHRIWLKNIWNFDGFTAKIFRWTPEFSPEREPSLVPVWVNFPLLPLHMCKKKILSAIGSAIGTPLKADLATAAMERVLRPSEARLCIEVDLLKHLPHRVWIGTEAKGKWQPVKYESLPDFCTKCSLLGHATAACKTKPTAPTTKVWMPKKNPAETVKEPSDRVVLPTPQDVGVKQMEPQASTRLGGENGWCDEKEKCEQQCTKLSQDTSLAIVKYIEATKMESPINRFLANLGHLLDLIKRQGQNMEPMNVTIYREEGELKVNSTRDMEECIQRQQVVTQEPSNPILQDLPLSSEVRFMATRPDPQSREQKYGLRIANNYVSLPNFEPPTLVKESSNFVVPQLFGDDNPNCDVDVNLITESVVPPTCSNCVLEDELDSETDARQISTFVVPQLIGDDKPKGVVNVTGAEAVDNVMTMNKVYGFEVNEIIVDSPRELVVSEQNDIDSRVSGFFGDRFLNDAWTNLVGLSHITPEFCSEESDSVKTAGTSPLSSPSGVAYVSNIFSRANLEEEKRRKYGMSDRVLRSMLRASNSDPCRPGSL